MNNRIKWLRTNANLTQSEMAQRVGVTQNYIWMMEKGDRAPSDRTIKDICREFSVDEVWLRTGVGEPFAPKSRKDAISEYMGQLHAGKRSDIEELLIEVMAETTVDEWRSIAAFLRRTTERMNEKNKETDEH